MNPRPRLVDIFRFLFPHAELRAGQPEKPQPAEGARHVKNLVFN